MSEVDRLGMMKVAGRAVGGWRGGKGKRRRDCRQSGGIIGGSCHTFFCCFFFFFLSRQKFCREKLTFVAINTCLRQNYVLVASKIFLSRQTREVSFS